MYPLFALSINNPPNCPHPFPTGILVGSGATVHAPHLASGSRFGVILRQPCGSSSQEPAETFASMHFAFDDRSPGSGQISAFSKPWWLRSV